MYFQVDRQLWKYDQENHKLSNKAEQWNSDGHWDGHWVLPLVRGKIGSITNINLDTLVESQGELLQIKHRGYF